MPINFYRTGSSQSSVVFVEAISKFNAGGAAKNTIPTLLAALRDPNTAIDPAEIWVRGIDPSTLSEGDPLTSKWVVKEVKSGAGSVRRWEEDK